MIEPLLTVPDVAKILRVSERTVRSLALDGELPSVRVRDRRLFDSEDVRAWIAQQKGGTVASVVSLDERRKRGAHTAATE